jgi:aminopeptidase N
MTRDFQKVMEEVSGEDLANFFEQWVFIKGYPEIKWNWKYKQGKVIISIEQMQKHHVFKFPLEFGVLINGKTKIETVQVTDKKSTFEVLSNEKPVGLVIDPEYWLLFEEKHQ